MEGARDRRGTWGRVARFTVVASSSLSEWTVIAIEISGTSTAIERIAYLFGSSPKQMTQATTKMAETFNQNSPLTLESKLLATTVNLATHLAPGTMLISSSLRCCFVGSSLDLNALACTLLLCHLLCWLASLRVKHCGGEWAETS